MGMKLGECRSQPLDDYYNYPFRTARIQEGYTLRQLAEQIGVSFSLISYYERVKAWPSPLIARRLSELLHKEVDELFPECLRDYVRERRNQKEKEPDVLYHAKPLPKNLKSNTGTQEQILEDLTQEEIQKRLDKILQTLSDREREIIRLRYGLGDGYSYTLEEVGKKFNITRERVRQLEAKAMGKLQMPSRAGGLISILEFDS